MISGWAAYHVAATHPEVRVRASLESLRCGTLVGRQAGHHVRKMNPAVRVCGASRLKPSDGSGDADTPHMIGGTISRARHCVVGASVDAPPRSRLFASDLSTKLRLRTNAPGLHLP